MDNNNEMNLSEATEALCTAESAVESMDEMIKLFGVFDENLKVISAETGARIIAAGDCIRIEGSAEAAELAKTWTAAVYAMPLIWQKKETRTLLLSLKATLWPSPPRAGE